MAKKREAKEPEKGNWLDTYADMVTLLLCFFVLLYSASSVDETKWQYIYQAFTSSGTYVNPFVMDEMPDNNATESNGNAEAPPNPDSSGNNSEEIEGLPQNFNQLFSYLSTSVEESDLGQYITIQQTPTRIFIRFDNTILFDGNSAVPGLYCILQHSPEKLVESAQKFMARTRVTHVKLKLFGDNEHDCKLVKTLRRTVGKDCFIAGDVNHGYPGDMDVLVPEMKALREAGLDACEDPADMPWTLWQELQKRVPDLHLIPDAPMRPAYDTLVTAQPCAGMIGNLHPDCMGSLIAAAELGKRLKKEEILSLSSTYRPILKY